MKAKTSQKTMKSLQKFPKASPKVVYTDIRERDTGCTAVELHSRISSLLKKSETSFAVHAVVILASACRQISAATMLFQLELVRANDNLLDQRLN